MTYPFDIPRRPRRNLPTLAAAVTAILLGFAGAAVSALWRGWALMVAIGIVHSSVLGAVHPIGYLLSVGLAAVLGFAFSQVQAAAS